MAPAQNQISPTVIGHVINAAGSRTLRRLCKSGGIGKGFIWKGHLEKMGCSFKWWNTAQSCLLLSNMVLGGT